MSITVRYFANLREQLGRSEDVLEVDKPLTVLQVWSIATGMTQLPNQILCAVNMEYADSECIVRKGDEVAFFPPVTGGCVDC